VKWRLTVLTNIFRGSCGNFQLIASKLPIRHESVAQCHKRNKVSKPSLVGTVRRVPSSKCRVTEGVLGSEQIDIGKPSIRSSLKNGRVKITVRRENHGAGAENDESAVIIEASWIAPEIYSYPLFFSDFRKKDK
jgi:hypothetical protein